MTTALVTGVTGFIGRALARRLAQSGVRVYGLVRAQSLPPDRPLRLEGVEPVVVTSTAREELEAALRPLRPELVFHLAAYGVRPDEVEPTAMLDGNVGLITRLLEALEGIPVRRFLFTGSCSEYAPVLAPSLLTEAHPLKPTSLYGAAKAAAGLYGHALARRLGIPFVGLRLFGVYGVGEAPHRLVPYVLEGLTRGESLAMTGGEQVRDLTYVDDVVDALLTAATASGIENDQTYNIASGKPQRIRDVAELVARLSDHEGNDLGFGRRPYRSDEPMWIVGDNSRFREATGWRPRIVLHEGIERMIAQHRAKKEPLLREKA